MSISPAFGRAKVPEAGARHCHPNAGCSHLPRITTSTEQAKSPRTRLGRASRRLVATDRDAIAEALVGVVVPEGMVLHAAIIPERDGIGLPFEPHAELGRLDMPEQHREKRVAFVLAQANDARCEGAIDEQALLASDRMRTHHRMLSPRKRLAGVVDAISSAIETLAVVDGGQAIDELSDRLR